MTVTSLLDLLMNMITSDQFSCVNVSDGACYSSLRGVRVCVYFSNFFSICECCVLKSVFRLKSLLKETDGEGKNENLTDGCMFRLVTTSEEKKGRRGLGLCRMSLHRSLKRGRLDEQRHKWSMFLSFNIFSVFLDLDITPFTRSSLHLNRNCRQNASRLPEVNVMEKYLNIYEWKRVKHYHDDCSLDILNPEFALIPADGVHA